MSIDHNHTWGCDCDGCGTRLNANQAEIAAERCLELSIEGVWCGSCRDEILAERKLDEKDGIIEMLRAEVEELEGKLLAAEEKSRKQGHHIDALRTELDDSEAFLQQAWMEVEKLREKLENPVYIINNFYGSGDERLVEWIDTVGRTCPSNTTIDEFLNKPSAPTGQTREEPRFISWDEWCKRHAKVAEASAAREEEGVL